MNKFQFGFYCTLSFFKSQNGDSLEEEYFEDFYKISLKICELESLTFQTEENKNNLISLYSEFKTYINKFESVVHNSVDWRLFISLFCTFMEWCDNVCYFNISEEEQKLIWSENPLHSYSIFNSY